ncbi:flagellar hook-basal body complex protein FliE [Paracidovorax avenae]|uniref:Flagellar hook-basal body complex protein FliE n=1 Tax=Paracidovorax avenae (strain ATCC 19860 / DSM 7227 / CCUG 15838 / JCM 20985 / LMG 2117 / NCPPB 1011) TaxID=643561 RepID=F0Q6W9_PARA1|nr:MULTISPECIES: flagellar hook-basal body complex protein FliE [Comamonadaceae]ADX48177.1 flagellar hook-basal body complex subunit FliE [Paracidovorax avenae ATCC 19860]AVS63566.1 flagellar hook-basal body complex protein FliE [Paracidovorax avenae]AVS65726.1 flagellar hook-basal body complex protein FliE [Paracidovorax avenae]AVS81383.1 flagellar hook-basal body complex protein FliE [Paracidovorax avenae]AVT21867.1 flagellar hook-basal body complex protein FliE [Paracidovorax avenae]
MDLRISSSTAPLTGAGLARRATAAPEAAAGQEVGFSTALKGALQSVSAAQNRASGLQQEVQMENPAVSLEETMIAIQKAQVGFQATLHVRNRMVQAYTDIMNMQV